MMLIFLWIFCQSSAFSEYHSAAIPNDSPRLKSKISRFSLQDPRVAINRLAESVKQKENLSLAELMQAYEENANRTDGYGPAMQEELIRALGKTRPNGAIDFLLPIFQSSAELRQKSIVVQALGDLGDPKAIPILTTFRANLTSQLPAETIARFEIEELISQIDLALEKIQGATQKP